MSVEWLVDKSVLARAHQRVVEDALQPRVQAGRVKVCILTELELGYSVRFTRDYDGLQALLGLLAPIVLPVQAEQLAREIQRGLVERGQHRAAAVPDLLIAATAATLGLTVLHYDGDFDLIAAVTGQPTEWIVPSGTAD